MQKKIIVLAIAAALSAPALALADAANVTPYGKVDVSVDRIDTGSGVPSVAATKGITKMVVSSNQSFFGLKGSEDLDGGLTALWQIESLINMDAAGGSTLGSRNTFAGLKGSFGTVLLGYNDSPFKSATRKLDVFQDGLADNRNLMGQVATAPATTTVPTTAFDTRNKDSISYLSPAFGAFTVAFQHSNGAETNNVESQPTAKTRSFAAMYNAGPVYATLASEKHDATNDKAARLGVGYTRDALNVGLVYEKIGNNVGTANKHSNLYLGGKYAVAGGAVKAAITKAGQVNSATDTGARQISLGYDHTLSKRTTAYVVYTKLSNEDKAGYTLGQTSSAGVTSSAGKGADPSAISFGMKHSF